jgi:hypothetical protein
MRSAINFRAIRLKIHECGRLKAAEMVAGAILWVTDS